MMNFSRTLVPITDGEVMIFWHGKVPATAPNEDAEKLRLG
jgi:hypothetical protein